jgi:very-short-patch-repair endonuclease
LSLLSRLASESSYFNGEIHQQQAEYDAERDQVLSARGLRLLRIKNEKVRQNLNSVLVHISTACSEET